MGDRLSDEQIARIRWYLNDKTHLTVAIYGEEVAALLSEVVALRAENAALRDEAELVRKELEYLEFPDLDWDDEGEDQYCFCACCHLAHPHHEEMCQWTSPVIQRFLHPDKVFTE